jgi:hypothetical protein
MGVFYCERLLYKSQMVLKHGPGYTVHSGRKTFILDLWQQALGSESGKLHDMLSMVPWPILFSTSFHRRIVYRKN